MEDFDDDLQTGVARLTRENLDELGGQYVQAPKEPVIYSNAAYADALAHRSCVWDKRAFIKDFSKILSLIHI